MTSAEKDIRLLSPRDDDDDDDKDDDRCPEAVRPLTAEEAVEVEAEVDVVPPLIFCSITLICCFKASASSSLSSSLAIRYAALSPSSATVNEDVDDVATDGAKNDDDDVDEMAEIV
jgi:hypothetical protein